MRVSIPDSTFQRDIHSRGLIETDRKKVEDYKARSKMLSGVRSSQEDINSIKDQLSEIQALKNEMAEIKELLRGLIK